MVQFSQEIKTDFYRIYFHPINPWDISFAPSEDIDFKGKIYLIVADPTPQEHFTKD